MIFVLGGGGGGGYLLLDKLYLQKSNQHLYFSHNRKFMSFTFPLLAHDRELCFRVLEL